MVDHHVDNASVDNSKNHPMTAPSDILIAEDDELLAKGLIHQIQHLGFNVIGPALDGLHAIELAQKHEPSLALLDVRMPMLDGIGAASIIFSKLGIPVVIVSAHSDETTLKKSQQAGVFGYLMKPVTIDQLRVTIAVSWARYCQHMSLQNEVKSLKTALEDRKYIERAKGLLMDRKGLGESEAMQRLRKQARNTRRRLADLARLIVESEQVIDQS